MIQGDFRAVEGAKAEGFSRGQFCLGVETLDNTAGQLPFGPEPVDQQRAVSAQHPGHFLHRIDLRAHGFGAPLVEEAPGPVRGPVGPDRDARIPSTAVGRLPAL